MPEMGGLEATAEIRKREAVDGSYTRIVAMTAHAMTGDRDRCLAAGMDGYMTKPFHQSLLFEVVEQGSAGASTKPVALNRNELMERLGGDTELLAEVIDLFLSDCPKRLADIKAAVDAGDAEQLRTAAHALKGAAGTIAAASVFEASQMLERLGAERKIDAAPAAFRHLSQEAAALMDTLRGLRNGTPDSAAGTPCAR